MDPGASIAHVTTDLFAFSRTGGMPPPDRELVTLHSDGTLDVWRSLSSRGVGRFCEQLAGEDLSTLARAIEGARREDVPPVDEPPPDASIDELRVDGTVLSVGRHAVVDGAWGSALDAARELLERGEPDATIVVELAGGDARLAHRGGSPLDVDLSNVTFVAECWRNGEAASRVEAASDGGRVEVGPGWQLHLAEGLDTQLSPQPGDILSARASFVVLDGSETVAAVCASTRTI